MKYVLSWFERPQGSPMEYENAQKRILEVFGQWKAPANFKIEFFVIRVGEWGGHMELMALAKAYGISINVLHGDGQIDKITPGDEQEEIGDNAREIWLGFYRHSHGLGEHYNSLRKAP